MLTSMCVCEGEGKVLGWAWGHLLHGLSIWSVCLSDHGGLGGGSPPLSVSLSRKEAKSASLGDQVSLQEEFTKRWD